MNTAILQKIGLTEGEIKVYLALLKLGSTTTGPLTDESGVHRSKIYHVLDRLIKKGLASSIIKEKTRHFQGAEPSQLHDYLEKREQEFKKQKQEIDKFIPQLKLAQQEAKKSVVQIFEGFKGMITVQEHALERLQSGEEYFFLGIPPEQPGHYHAYWLQMHKRRSKKGIKTKLLFHPSTKIEIIQSRNKEKGCDARYMPVAIDTPAWFMGYQGTAVIGFPSKNPVTIEITNQEIADSFKAYFEAYWKQTKKLPPR